PAERSVTLLEAAAMAGGFTKDADLNKVKVMRVEEGRRNTIFVNIKDITEKDQKDKDIPLQADDIVFVPESFF
ncbi:MAG: polysaccharide export protein, partial [Candidatus Omnitrophica bacterium]|nr:polysaccharide export protein [Candidatus Omnitrophota bacterium]